MHFKNVNPQNPAGLSWNHSGADYENGLDVPRCKGQ